MTGDASAPTALDLRLLLPALTAWAVLAWAVPWPPLRLALLGAGGVVAAVAAEVLRRRGKGRFRPRPVVALTLAATGLVLLAGAGHRSVDLAGPVPELARQRAVVRVEGSVVTEPRLVQRADEREDLVVLRLRLTSVEGRGRQAAVRTPVLVLAEEDWLEVSWRQRVGALARLGPPDPGQDVVALLSPLTPPEAVGELPLVLRTAEHARERLRASVGPLPADARGLIPGLVIGDTSLTPPELTDAMLVTGLSHLSAVSGSNVAIVLGAVVLLCGWWGVPRRWRPPLAALSLVAFVVLCRPEPSVLRAGAMGLVGLLALSTSRRRVSLPALATAVLVLLCADPWLARSYGFALSTLATLGLVVFARPWGDAMARWLPRRLRLLGHATAIPLAAQVVCAPVIVLLQGTVSTVAVLTNLLAAPLVAPTTIAGIVAALGGLLWAPLGVLAAWTGALPAWLIGRVARWGAVVPFGSVEWVDGATGAWLLTALTVVLLLTGRWLWHAVRCRPGRTAGAVVVLLVTVWPFPATSGWPPQGWVVAGCDVGQGDAFVLASGPGRAVLVDVGPDPAPIRACLRRLGVRAVDAVVLSHFHADHVAGLEGVLDHVPVAAAYLSPVRDPPAGAWRVHEQLAAAGVPAHELTAGHRLGWGTVSAQVLWPPPGRSHPAGPEGTAANDGSVVLLADVSGVTVLLTGDVETVAAAGVRRALGDRPVDVLKVAHHGSSVQDERLVTGSGVSVALIGVGADNPFGHPAPGALRLLERAGATVLRTDTDGDVAVVRGPEGLSVATRGP